MTTAQQTATALLEVTAAKRLIRATAKKIDAPIFDIRGEAATNKRRGVRKGDPIVMNGARWLVVDPSIERFRGEYMACFNQPAAAAHLRMLRDALIDAGFRVDWSGRYSESIFVQVA
jgi:hypothetical protein